MCIAIPGGPGVAWNYLRMPAVERHARVVYLEPLGTGESGRLPTHPHGYTRAEYAAGLDRLIDHLGVAHVYLLGHSYGGFVAQYYAAHHPDRVAGVVLYGSSPVTGEEHDAEAAQRVAEFAARNAGNPELPAVLEALQSVPTITDDDALTAALRGLVPAHLADYWTRAAEFEPLRSNARVTYISAAMPTADPA